jgi:hypothetical protein
MYIFYKLQTLRFRISVRYLCFVHVAANMSVLRPLFLLLLLLLFLMLLLSYDVAVIKAVIPAATATYFAAAVAFADVDRLISFGGFVVLICQC